MEGTVRPVSVSAGAVTILSQSPEKMLPVIPSVYLRVLCGRSRTSPARALLHNGDLLGGQAVEFIDQLVDLTVRGGDLTLERSITSLRSAEPVLSRVGRCRHG